MVNLPIGLRLGKLNLSLNYTDDLKLFVKKKHQNIFCFSFYSRIGEIMAEIVNDYGVVWTASAGNHGLLLRQYIAITFARQSFLCI